MLKVLTHFAHATYQTELSKIPGIEFYHVEDKTGVWPEEERPKGAWPGQGPKPNNIHAIDIIDVDPTEYHAILVHWHPFITTFCKQWPTLPAIFLEHTHPYMNRAGQVNYWKNVRHEHINHTVFITPTSRKAWDAEKDGQSSYIYHSFDVSAFPQKTDYSGKAVMTTTNEMITRDWACGFSLWANVLGVPNKAYFNDISLYGYGNDNIGKVSKGSRTREEVLDLLVNAGVYFNPSIMSPIPMSLLEAMAVGTPVVSTAHCEPGNLFKNGIHGIFSNDPVKLREGIQYILDNPYEAKKMAENAKKVVTDIFAPARFIDEWSKVFKMVKENE